MVHAIKCTFRGLSCEPNNQLNFLYYGEVGLACKIDSSHPSYFITDRSIAAVLLWFPLACFSATFHLMFVKISFSSVWVAEWSPFGKDLPTPLTICSVCILTFCNFNLFPVLMVRAGFGF